MIDASHCRAGHWGNMQQDTHPFHYPNVLHVRRIVLTADLTMPVKSLSARLLCASPIFALSNSLPPPAPLPQPCVPLPVPHTQALCPPCCCPEPAVSPPFLPPCPGGPLSPVFIHPPCIPPSHAMHMYLPVPRTPPVWPPCCLYEPILHFAPSV
jgi:hypothetical protein